MLVFFFYGVNMIESYENAKFEDYYLLVVLDHLSIIFMATLHVWWRLSELFTNLSLVTEHQYLWKYEQK
jgi:hypothetical protein